MSQHEHDKLPELKPCPICGNTDLYTGALSCDSQGVHCMHISDDTVGILLMAERGNKEKQREILASPELRGCGLKIARSYPKHRPPECKTLEDLEHFVLLQAIEIWNTRICDHQLHG